MAIFAGCDVEVSKDDGSNEIRLANNWIKLNAGQYAKQFRLIRNTLKHVFANFCMDSSSNVDQQTTQFLGDLVTFLNQVMEESGTVCCQKKTREKVGSTYRLKAFQSFNKNPRIMTSDYCCDTCYRAGCMSAMYEACI